jgi:hypothetical protein
METNGDTQIFERIPIFQYWKLEDVSNIIGHSRIGVPNINMTFLSIYLAP